MGVVLDTECHNPVPLSTKLPPIHFQINTAQCVILHTKIGPNFSSLPQPVGAFSELI